MIMTEEEQLLRMEFDSLVRQFQSGESFGSALLRMDAIDEIIEIRNEMERLGMGVMSEAELTEITGDF